MRIAYVQTLKDTSDEQKARLLKTLYNITFWYSDNCISESGGFSGGLRYNVGSSFRGFKLWLRDLDWAEASTPC